MVNSESLSNENSFEIHEYDYREGKVKHYYEFTYDENDIIVFNSIDNNDTFSKLP